MLISVSQFLFDGLVIVAWVFLVWGIVKATQAGNPKRMNDYAFQVKTFWVLFLTSLFWLILTVTNVFVGEPFWGECILAIGFGWSAYVSNGKVRALLSPKKSI